MDLTLYGAKTLQKTLCADLGLSFQRAQSNDCKLQFFAFSQKKYMGRFKAELEEEECDDDECALSRQKESFALMSQNEIGCPSATINHCFTRLDSVLKAEKLSSTRISTRLSTL